MNRESNGIISHSFVEGKKKRKEKTNSIQFNVISFLRSNDTQVLKILL